MVYAREKERASMAVAMAMAVDDDQGLAPPQAPATLRSIDWVLADRGVVPQEHEGGIRG